MDKKLKNAADKIKMPDDMKQRIISAAELAERNRSNTDSDDYIEVVRSSERITQKSLILRTVSTIAACAVLVGGLGAAGVFLHRHKNGNLTGGESSEYISSPFGDFSTHDFRFVANDGQGGHYTATTYSRIADFLNKFDWGEKVSEDSVKGNDKFIYMECNEDDYDYRKRAEVLEAEGEAYYISWSTSEGYSHIDIVEGGFVSFTDFSSNIATDGVDIVIDTGYYRIDFEAFDSGIQEILAADADVVSPFGDFRSFDYKFDAGDGKYGSYSAETYAKLSDFLNKFNWGVELGMSEAENDDETLLLDLVHEKYTITWTKGDTPPVNCNIYVSKTGYVLYNEDIEYLETDEDRFIESRSYRIDFDAFDSGIQAILNNESGDLISAELRVNNKSGDDIIISPESAEVKGYLENFLRNEFIPMLKSDIYAEGSDDIRYTVVMNYKVNKNTTLRKSYYICGDGFVNLCEYEVTGMEEVPAGCENFTIDFAEFESYLKKYGINAESSTETFESADLVFEQHETLTPTDEEDKAKFEDFVRNDFVKMLEPTSSDDIVGGVKYSIIISYDIEAHKKRTESYFIFMDGCVECNEYKTDENGEMQLTNTEKYKIDVDKLESVLKEEIGVELPEYREININKAD